MASRIAGGDPLALQELYDRYARATFGFLIGSLDDRASAEDVQQQVFLDVWRSASTYDPARGSLLTWIMSIARNRAIDHKRRRIPIPSGNMPAEHGDATVDEAEVLAERWRVASLLDRLHAEEREVLRLRFYEDLTQAEISERMEMPLGTVKMRMVDGLERLRELMGDSR